MIHLPTGTNGPTAFFGTTFEATPNQLINLLGEITKVGSGDHKVGITWIRELDNAEQFTIYDWKYYREIGPDEKIVWHIGGASKNVTEKAKQEILSNLK
jgi:hypothetical protein